MLVMAHLAADEARSTCPACGGRGSRELPGSFDVDDLACPVCHPWSVAFPGEKVGDHFIILPALPGEAAEWVGP